MSIDSHEKRLTRERNKFYKEHAAEPPAHLSERAKGLWRGVVPSTIRCPERLALLQSGLEALDRADQAREAISREGLTTVTARSSQQQQPPHKGADLNL